MSDNPCWNGYKMAGHKTKNGKKVPNCVPIDEIAEVAEYMAGHTGLPTLREMILLAESSPFKKALAPYQKMGQLSREEKPSIIELVTKIRKDKSLKIPNPANPKKMVTIGEAIRRVGDGKKKHPAYNVACAALGQHLLAVHPELKNSIDNNELLGRSPGSVFTKDNNYFRREEKGIYRHDHPDAAPDDPAHPTKSWGKQDQERRKDVDRGVYGDMYKQIKNSDTGNKVNVKTVLGYGSKHPDYDKAMDMLDKPGGTTGSGRDIKLPGRDKNQSPDQKAAAKDRRKANKASDADAAKKRTAIRKKKSEGLDEKVRSHMDDDNKDDHNPSIGHTGNDKTNYGNANISERIRLSDLISERDYKSEYENYHSQPEQRKRRSERNKARRKMAATGKVSKGDGKDVHHKNHNTSDMSSDNLAAIPKSKNRSQNRKK